MIIMYNKKLRDRERNKKIIMKKIDINPFRLLISQRHDEENC